MSEIESDFDDKIEELPTFLNPVIYERNNRIRKALFQPELWSHHDSVVCSAKYELFIRIHFSLQSLFQTLQPTIWTVTWDAIATLSLRNRAFTWLNELLLFCGGKKLRNWTDKTG